MGLINLHTEGYDYELFNTERVVSVEELPSRVVLHYKGLKIGFEEYYYVTESYTTVLTLIGDGNGSVRNLTVNVTEINGKPITLQQSIFVSSIVFGIPIVGGTFLYLETDGIKSTMKVEETIEELLMKFNATFIAPASISDIGVKGEIRITNTHLYVCTDDNSWKRIDLTTW